MSTDTISSSDPRATSRRPPLGSDSTGLPATHTNARICPGPGVSISSARQTAGSSPNVPGRSRTRDRGWLGRTPRPSRGAPRVFEPPTAGVVNIAPPGRSRLPVHTLSTSTSQLATVPNSAVVVPMRPYTAARGAATSSRASRRIVAASTPVTSATSSGPKEASAGPSRSTPSTYGATSPRSTSSSSSITRTIAARRNGSLPGRTAIHSSASSAVRLRRGSTTTSLPPRARSASIRPGQSGAVARLPFDA